MQHADETATSEVYGRVTYNGTGEPIIDAEVYLLKEEEETPAQCETTDEEGNFRFTGVPPGEYHVVCEVFGGEKKVGARQRAREKVTVEGGRSMKHDVVLSVGKQLEVDIIEREDGGKEHAISSAKQGKEFVLRVGKPDENEELECVPPPGVQMFPLPSTDYREFSVTPLEPGPKEFKLQLAVKSRGAVSKKTPKLVIRKNVPVAESAQFVRGELGVRLQRSFTPPTIDRALWAVIKSSTQRIEFGRYRELMNLVFEADVDGTVSPVHGREVQQQLNRAKMNLRDVRAYEILQAATDIFLLLSCHTCRPAAFKKEQFSAESRSPSRLPFASADYLEKQLAQYLGSQPYLPYITRVIRNAFPALLEESRNHGFEHIEEPCLLELIWCYWHEEGMLVQTMNAISQRFRNIHAPGDHDPLAHLEIDPLRPLNNVIWGWTENEHSHLSIRRRAYEYDHEYGLRLYGKSIDGVWPADERSKFLEAFHNLLHLSFRFFGQDNQTTVIADGFPLLNALKETHLVLAQGAHNQFRDLPWVARREMMMQEWILARPEIRDFLQSRIMVPYQEAWMPQVDTMKTLQGWTDVTISHFRDLAVYGEQILLSVRYGDWIGVNDEDSAKNWARYWRPEIQAYMHSYRAVTGIDLTNPDTVDATVPAVHLQRRLALQQGAR